MRFKVQLQVLTLGLIWGHRHLCSAPLQASGVEAVNIASQDMSVIYCRGGACIGGAETSVHYFGMPIIHAAGAVAVYIFWAEAHPDDI